MVVTRQVACENRKYIGDVGIVGVADVQSAGMTIVQSIRHDHLLYKSTVMCTYCVLFLTKCLPVSKAHHLIICLMLLKACVRAAVRCVYILCLCLAIWSLFVLPIRTLPYHIYLLCITCLYLSFSGELHVLSVPTEDKCKILDQRVCVNCCC